MKILVINSLYPPYHRGGAEVVVQTLTNSLKKEHEMHVLTLQPWKGFSSMRTSSQIEDSVTVHRFFSLNIFSFINIERHSFSIRLIWHILDAINIHSYFVTRDLIRRIKPDLVLSHNVKGIGYTILRAIQCSNVRTIHTVHDVQMIEPSGLIMWGNDQVLNKPSLIQWLTIVGSRWLAGSPKKVIFPSRFLKELYGKYGFFKQSEKVIFPNPVADDFLITSEKVKQLHAPCHFLILGQVGEHKGIRVAIEALQMAPNLACRLSIVGDGALVNYVKEQTKKDPRIEYLGRLDRDQVRKTLSETDYVIVPSLCYENSPMAIYESMAMGTPVIAARIGGVAELVDDGVNGYIVTPGSIQELADALQKAANNSIEYTNLSKAARKKVEASAVSVYREKLLTNKT